MLIVVDCADNDGDVDNNNSYSLSNNDNGNGRTLRKMCATFAKSAKR